MISPDVNAAAEAWLADAAIAESDKFEIRRLLADIDSPSGATSSDTSAAQAANAARIGAAADLTDRFYRDLEFGTGGMRGVIGAGRNRMNIYTVGAAAQGLAAYILQQEVARGATAEGGKAVGGGTSAVGGSRASVASPSGDGGITVARGVAIAHDSRRMSREFATRVACVMAANGIVAHLFDDLRPTPALSFAVRHLGCIAGVVITASHNPPEYNGLKAYWEDGGQVVPPRDASIVAAVRAVGAFSNVKAINEAEARRAGLIRNIGREVDEAFLEACTATCLAPDTCREQGRGMRIVYTALHGTGGTLAPEALRRRGFRHVIEVPEQARPDGEFPTVESPNPEEAPALRMAIELARREGAPLVIGTDPDADRMGIAVRNRAGDYELVSGNRIGALMTWYLCEQRRRNGTLPADGAVLSTIVSSDLMKEIARGYGLAVVETLTGFKWIAEKVREFEEARAAGRASHTYLFGAEESYGYMPAAFVRDKDAITATALIAEIAAVAAAEGKTLLDILDELFRRFGYYQEGARSLTLKGADGARQIAAIMAGLRASPPTALAGQPVAWIGDLMTGERRAVHAPPVTSHATPALTRNLTPPLSKGGHGGGSRGSHELLGRYDLPASDVIVMALEDGTKVIARPSGTEPKIKFYILAREDGTDLPAARARAAGKIEAIAAEMARMAERLAG